MRSTHPHRPGSSGGLRAAGEDAPGRGSFSIAIRVHPAGLQVEVEGEGSFANTVAYWEAVVAQVREQDARGVLLIDRMHGPALSAGQWHSLVRAMEGKGLERVRIAHVKPNGLQAVEYCEIYAVEAGLDARVFADERIADLWLRHGER